MQSYWFLYFRILFPTMSITPLASDFAVGNWPFNCPENFVIDIYIFFFSSIRDGEGDDNEVYNILIL